jgi:hypothetical protein
LTRFIKTTLFCSLLALAPACGDDDGNDGSGTPDANTGGDIDAAAPSEYSGQILWVEASSPMFPPQAGDGMGVQAKFIKKTDKIPTVYEEIPGAPFGCKVTEYTGEEYYSPGVDVGAVQLAATGAPPMPPCNWTEQGYQCVGLAGGADGVDIAVVDADMGIYSLTDPATTFTADEAGRVLALNGRAEATNNGMFPIIASGGDLGDHTLQFAGMGVVDETGTTGTYATIAGIPIPTGLDDPLADDAEETLTITPGTGTPAGEFNVANFAIGQSFTLDDATADLLGNVPLDGSEFAMGCDGAGGTCGDAMVSVVNITTTDGEVSPTNPFPFPASKMVEVVCISVTGTATVNETASAYLMNSGATSMRNSFLRVRLADQFPDNLDLFMAVGHLRYVFQIIPPG